MRVLIIEDDRSLALALKRNLQPNFAVDLAYCGTKGTRLALSHDYDAIILDLQLPDATGHEICKELRSNCSSVPILILTGFQYLGSKLALFNDGADDYVVKPCNTAEIKARLRALLRRAPILQSEILEVHGLRLNRLTQIVTYHHKPIKLARKEYLILEHLLLCKNRPVSRMELIDHVWEDTYVIQSNTVDVHISKLRHKLNHVTSQQLIRTVHGLGYMINV